MEKTQKTSLNNTHRHVLCASVCFITCDITDKNLLCSGIYSHRFYGKKVKIIYFLKMYSTILDQQHCYHHVLTVKPEAATAVVELLMMGVRTPETCCAVHKRQVINLRNCCICLVDLFETYDNARTCKL